jgi:RNA polymerase sigma-B factor
VPTHVRTRPHKARGRGHKPSAASRTRKPARNGKATGRARTGSAGKRRPPTAEDKPRHANGKLPNGLATVGGAGPQETLLLRRYAETKDAQLKEQLTERFLPLARSLALRYRGGTEPLDDLIQVASLGLIKALDGFDPERGRSFTAYAVPTILGELRRHFRDRVWNVHLPRGLQERTMEVNDAIQKLSDELGRSPTVSHISERLELAEEQVLEALQADEARRTLSLDAPRSREDAESAPAVETVGGAERGYEAVESQMCSADADLDEREQLVLRLRFGRDLNQYEIGGMIGVSQMQVSRIMRGALRKLLQAVQEQPA